MKNDFNLRNYLTENKLTTVSRELKESLRDKVELGSIVMGGVDRRDHPEYSDAYIESANFQDGRDLTDSELDRLGEEMQDELSDLAYLDAVSETFRENRESNVAELAEEGKGDVLKIGQEYEVHELGMDEWMPGLEYIGYDRNEREHIFRDSTIAPGSNEVFIIKISQDDADSMVR
jgi:hypothetical protein